MKTPTIPPSQELIWEGWRLNNDVLQYAKVKAVIMTHDVLCIVEVLAENNTGPFSANGVLTEHYQHNASTTGRICSVLTVFKHQVEHYYGLGYSSLADLKMAPVGETQPDMWWYPGSGIMYWPFDPCIRYALKYHKDQICHTTSTDRR